ncbi:MAG TPA: VOC family protein [Vicinamibacterales bacterium]|nr:VOC family protein [Vicinamibacterales bacterium]
MERGRVTRGGSGLKNARIFRYALSANRMPHNTLESLDYIYVPAPDVDAAEQFYTTMLGGRLRWRIRDGGVTVAAVQLCDAAPLLLLASHLAAKATILIYRVASLAATRQHLLDARWTDLDEPFEIPQGPCLVFRDPAGQQLAIYERTRPFVERSFEGRFD